MIAPDKEEMVMTVAIAHTDANPQPNGFRPFNDGDRGKVHDRVHRLIDDGRYDEARTLLADWLAHNDGSGSEWVHLQWHLAVLELGSGASLDALDRFQAHIRPAIEAGEALTDGPSLLWRLCMAGSRGLRDDWERVRAAADRPQDHRQDPYVELHDALALAGARDLRSLDRWLDAHLDGAGTEEDRILLKTAWGLRSFASRDFGAAAALLADAAVSASRLGGSRAQNALFEQIRGAAARRLAQPGRLES
jgi:hypothetical protein